MHRRAFLLATAALAVSGCQTVTRTPPAQAPAAPAKALVAGSGEQVSIAGMKIVDVDIVLNPGMGRPFRYAGLEPSDVHAALADKVKTTLNAANPTGSRPARAQVKLSAIVIADKAVRGASYDSVVAARATYFDVETGEQIGDSVGLGAQATYRPRFLSGQDQVLLPEQELELITTHSTRVLAKQTFR